LGNQIDELATKGIITKDIRDWAHTIRYLGNDGAHPYDKGKLTKVTKNDAIDILKFLEAYFEYVYILPDKVAKKGRI